MIGNNSPQIIVAQLGARMHYAVPILLYRADMLAHFFTDAYVGPGSSWHPVAELVRLFLPELWRPLILRKLLGREAKDLPAEKVTAFNLLGWRYARALSKTENINERIKISKVYAQQFCHMILKHNSFKGDGVYAFQGAALPLFQKCSEKDMLRIYEQFGAPETTLYHLLIEEHIRWPDWELSHPDLSLFRNCLEPEEQAWAAADAVICPSDFVAGELTSHGLSQSKIYVVPYGVNTPQFTMKRYPWDGKRSLHLLYVGSITLHKGVQYLWKAIQLLSSTNLKVRLVGPLVVSSAARRCLREVAELVGNVPRSEVARHYEWADVFVFPSICEGSATVTYEALAAGLPVITTPNAGSVVRDGIDGFIVPIRTAEALAQKIEFLLRDPALLPRMSESALARAQEFSWERYGERLSNVLKKAYQSYNTKINH